MHKDSFSFLENETMNISSSGEKVSLSRLNWNVQLSLFNYKSATLGSLWGGKGQFYGRPQSPRFSSHALSLLPPLSHLILNAQQKPHGCRAQWTRHKRSGMFCVLSGQDAEKLRKRQSYRHGQGHVRWHDQLELSQHVLLSAGIWPNALRSCVQTTSRHLLFSVIKDSRIEWD